MLDFAPMLLQELRLALRTIVKQPAFSAVVIVSLALGIGTHTAVLGLWNGILHAPLPGVRKPNELVMLSDPGAWRMVRGQWESRRHGSRPLFSFAEFESLRDNAGAFSALMASQGPLFPWQVRIDGGEWEEVRGRLVSEDFFDVLGVNAAIGRLFTRGEAEREPSAVISHHFWRRRFAARPEVVGKSLALSGTVLTIVGVAPPGFVGETRDQQPDVWFPIHLQPLVLRGRDLLHDRPPSKIMWLHVFGRLKPNATLAQADAEANAVLQANLRAFYGGSGSSIDRSQSWDDRLQVRPGARGASATRGEVSSSLTIMLATAGVLLLILCVNLANLLLARAAARQADAAVRAAVGATSGALARHVVTEVLALSVIGGLGGAAVTYVLHGALVRLIAATDPRFAMESNLDARVLAFLVIATAVAGLLLSALPAWYATRIDPSTALKAQSRGGVGTLGQIRSGRVLASLQLALSFPLLVSAGLLIRTLDNLQRADLGFDTKRLLVVRVDAVEAAPQPMLRARLIRELRRRFQEIPGVGAATFSRLGLFTGAFTSTKIEVEGYAPQDDSDRETALDVIGPAYFSTLGVAIVRGREIVDSDGDDAPKVCVINEAFADRFFRARDPIGLRISTVADDGMRTAYNIVGVVGNARTQSLRERTEPRVFLPGEQRISAPNTPAFLIQDYPTFLIRTRGPSAPMVPTARKVVQSVDAALPILSARSLDEQMLSALAQDRTSAKLALVFGCLALMLAATGLFAVLSYGVRRRWTEIAIRIALGADTHRINAMVVRETAGLVLAGLVIGACLAYAASRLIEGRLYGVAPHDPLTLALAAGTLVCVAFVAAYVPARHAARMDPMAVLRQG